MKKMKPTSWTALLLITLVFSLSAQPEQGFFGSNSRPELCWTIYQKSEGPSLETLRFYSLPLAWGEEQQTPESPKMVNVIALNERSE